MDKQKIVEAKAALESLEEMTSLVKQRYSEDDADVHHEVLKAEAAIAALSSLTAEAAEAAEAQAGTDQHATAMRIVHEEAGRTLSRDDFDLCMRIAKRALLQAGQVADPAKWTIFHDGKSVTADTLTGSILAAQELRTDEEMAVATRNLMAAIDAELEAEAAYHTEDRLEMVDHFRGVTKMVKTGEGADLARITTEALFSRWLNGRSEASISVREAFFGARQLARADHISHPVEMVKTDEGVDLNDNEDNPAALWAEIHRLRAQLKGPDGYATWKHAAVAERVRRVKAETAGSQPLAWLIEPNEKAYQGPDSQGRQLSFDRPINRSDWTVTPLGHIAARKSAEKPAEFEPCPKCDPMFGHVCAEHGAPIGAEKPAVPDGCVIVNRQAVEWLRERKPVLCEKAGLRELSAAPAQEGERPQQPPCTNDYVADGCEKFQE